MRLFGHRKTTQPMVPIRRPSLTGVRSIDYMWLEQGGGERRGAVLNLPLVSADQLSDPEFDAAAARAVAAPVGTLVRHLGDQAPAAADMVRAAKIGWSIGRYEERVGLAVPGLTHYLVHNGLCRARQLFPEFGMSDALPYNLALEVGYYISRTDEVPEPV